MTDASPAPLRARLAAFLERPAVQRLVIAVILANAVTLGLETSATAMAAAGPLLLTLDKAALAFFTVEIALKLVAYGRRFFTSGWNVFDLVVIAIGLVPTAEGFSVIRALRILRVLRLASAVPSMRRVADGLLAASPGMGAIVMLLALVYYVSAVVATKLFGATAPAYFGTLGSSAYTLFQVMTLDDWSQEFVRPLLDTHPYAWAFFILFILVTTFTVLNLFIAVIVNAMQARYEAEHKAEEDQAHAEREQILVELRALRAELAATRAERRV